MSQHSSNPWDRDRFGIEPPRSRRSPLVVLFAVLSALALVVIVGGVAIYLVAKQFPIGDDYAALTPDLDTPAPPHAVDWAVVRRAFSSPRELANKRQIARLEKLLNEFLRATNEEDTAGVHKVVDYPRFLREMRKTRFQSLIDQYERPDTLRQLVDGLQGISGWDHVRVMQIEKTPKAGEVVVYAHGYHADGYSNPARFWVVDRGRPLVFDWEMTEYGSRESGEWATFYAYSGDRRIDEYYQAMGKVSEAESLWAQGEREAARQALRAASQATVPKLLHDQLLLYVAYTYLSWSDAGAVHEHVARLLAPYQAPGAHLVAAQAHQMQSDLTATLAAIDKYESIIGVTPQSLTVRAACFESQERWTEATAQHARLAQLIPDDIDALKNWGLMLGESEKAPLVRHVRALADPPAVAISLLQQFMISGDVDAAQAMAEILRPHAEHALWVDLVQAYEKQIDAENTAAAAIYEKVWRQTNDEALRERAHTHWLDASASAEQHLTAYQQSPDAKETFLYFVGGYEDGESSLDDEEFKALVAAHRQREPDDPWGYYYAAIAASENEQHDVAARLLEEGLNAIDAHNAKATQPDAGAPTSEKIAMFDDFVAEMFTDRHVSELVSAGRAADAYAAATDSAATFRTIASLLRFKEGGTEELQLLVANHTAAHPDDPWPTYYRAVVAQQQKRFDVADRILELAQSTSAVQDDEELLNMISSLRVNIAQDVGNFTEALRAIEPMGETFNRLAEHLHSQQNWNALSELVDEFEAEQGADDPLCIRWRANLHRAQHDDAALAELLHPWPEGEIWPYWQAKSARNDLFRALVRLSRWDDARQFAQRCLDVDEDPWPLVHLYLAEENPSQAKALIQRHRDTTYRLNNVYGEVPCEPNIWSAQYHDLRREFPPGLTSKSALARAGLLCASPAKFSVETTRAALTDLFSGDLLLAEIPPAGDGAPCSIMLTADDCRIAVTWGTDKFQHDDRYIISQIKDAALSAAWRDHAGWIAIDILEVGTEQDAGKLARQVVLRLADANATMFYLDGVLLPASDVARGLLENGADIETLRTAGTAVWLYRDAAEDSPTWNRRRPISELDRLFASRTDSDQFFVQVALTAGHAQEQTWLKLVRVTRPGHRERTFIAEFVEPSVIDPRFTTGEHVHVEAYEVMNWKQTTGSEVTWGKPPD